MFYWAGCISTASGLLITGSVLFYTCHAVRKKIFALLMVAIYVLPVAMFGTYRLIDRQVYTATYSFTVEKWANADEDDRAHIIDFFREGYDLVGESIDTVPPLLGAPDSVTDTAYYYNLGYHKYYLGVDPVYYLVEFDSQNIIFKEGVYEG